MFRERAAMRRRRGLNPSKVVFVYGLAFLLVCWHQSGRVAGWFEDQALARQGLLSQASFAAAGFLDDRVAAHGPDQLNRLEDRARDWLAAVFAGEEPPAAPKPAPARRAPVAVGVDAPEAGPRGAAPGQTAFLTARLDAGAAARSWSPPRSADEEEGIPPPAAPWRAAPRAPAGPAPQAGIPRAPAPRPDFKPARVLLLGDSMMLEGLGPQLQRELKKHEGLTVNRDGRYGTGLARLDAFDWLAYFDEMLDQYTPDLVIITLGANDTQDIVEPGQKRLSVSGEEWNAVYADRVADLLARAAATGAKVFWVGLPVMGQEPYGARVVNINRVTAAACAAAPNCRFWDSTRSVADDQGKYAVFLPDGQGKTLRVRAKDAIHLTESGGRLMAEKFLAETSGWADYAQSEGPAGEGPAASGHTPSEAPAVVSRPPAPDRPASDRSGSLRQDLRLPAPSAGDEDFDFDAAAGRVLEYRYHSPARNKDVPFFVAAPKFSAKRPGPFPVVWLLHGAWDGPASWVTHLGEARLAGLADRLGLILVMPDGEPFGWYLDGRETAIETHVTVELQALIREWPRADTRRQAITGLSMGGHGALTLALKHPDLFRAAGAMSAVTDLSAHAGRAHTADPQLKIDRVLGPSGPGGAAWRPYGALGLTGSAPRAWAGRPLILGVGQGDRLTLAENRAFHQLLTDLNIKHVYAETPGGHDWPYWSAQLPIQLEFLSEKLKEER